MILIKGNVPLTFNPSEASRRAPSLAAVLVAVVFAAALAGCSSPQKSCYDMYAECQNINGKCTRGYPGCDVYGKASCGTCLECCLEGITYPKPCNCRKCGFE
jgi:hypothetical protein